MQDIQGNINKWKDSLCSWMGRVNIATISILGGTSWWRSRWTWSTSLSTDTSGIPLQTQKYMQKTSWEQTGVPDQWKRIYRTMQNSVGWRKWGKNRSVSRAGPALSQWGNWNRGLIPTLGRLSEPDQKHLRLRVKQLFRGHLNGMRTRESFPQPYIPQTGTQVPWKAHRLGAGA